MGQDTDFENTRRRLTRIAVGMTVAYTLVLCGLASAVLLGEEGSRGFTDMEPNEVGDLLAGVVGPVALIWLVFGYFLQGLAIRQQGVELKQNTEALRLQAVALNAQVVELANSVAQQEQLVVATNAQVHAMREAIRPAFVIQSLDGRAKYGILLVANIGANAAEVKISVSSDVGNVVGQSKFSHVSNGGEVGVHIDFSEILFDRLK
jgi:hypothetical protein